MNDMKEGVKNCCQNHGKWVKVIFAVVVVIIVVSMFSCDHRGYGDKNIAKNTITVTGKAEKMVKPDIATVTMGVNEEAKTVGAAQDKATAKINATMEALKTLGVDTDKDVKTTNYNIYPRYDYVKTAGPVDYYPYGGKQVLAAYVVTQSLEVKIRDLAKAGDILAKVGTIGLNDVSGLQFSVDKEDAVKDEIRGAAISDGKSNAKVLAKELGVRLGKLVSYSEGGNYPIYARMDMVSSAMGGGEAKMAPVIATGENKITSNVTLVYEIK
jgi:hypothetical protein